MLNSIPAETLSQYEKEKKEFLNLMTSNDDSAEALNKALKLRLRLETVLHAEVTFERALKTYANLPPIS